MVTLVHGTWAAHADWLQDGHELPDALTARPGTALHRFCWSGRNRHRARLQAGCDLRDHLAGLVTAYREAGADPDHHVIAHSHGGNVALYALRESGDRRDDALAGIEVTTLATPFLTMRRRPLPKKLFVMLPVLLLTSLLGALVVALELGIPPQRIPDGWLTAIGVWSLLGIGSAVLFLRSLQLYRRVPSPPRLRDILLSRAVPREADRLSAHPVSTDRLLVIRGLGDEASGLLGAAQLSAWMMAKVAVALKVRTVLILLALIFVAAVVATPGDIAPKGLENRTSIPDYLVSLFFLVILGGFLGAQLIAGLVAIANLPFGADSLFWNFHAQTTAEPAPPGISRLLVVGHPGSAEEAPEELAHSLYEDPAAIRGVLARIEGRDPFVAVGPDLLGDRSRRS